MGAQCPLAAATELSQGIGEIMQLLEKEVLQFLEFGCVTMPNW